MKTKILYLDVEHNHSSKEGAKWKVIHTYDENGRLEKEVWVDLKA
jgi:hypothetical protein